MRPLALTNVLQQGEEMDEEQTLGYIFETYYKRIYNYIYYRVNNHFTAEDLTSQVFEKAMRSMGSYSANKSPFEVWLIAIARNVVNDHFRSLRRGSFFSLETLKGLFSKEKSPEDFVVMAERNDELARALSKLTARERHVIALKFGANLKNHEIAELLDISESNAGVILYRTMKKMKLELEMDNYESKSERE